MNSLSWLLYGADVSEGLRWVTLFSMIVCGLIIAGSIAGFFAMLDDGTADEGYQSFMKWMGKVWGLFVPIFLVSMLVFILTPQRNTIMLIAASEVGETVLASSQAQTIGGEAGELAVDSLRVLRKFINDQLDEPSEGTKQ